MRYFKLQSLLLVGLLALAVSPAAASTVTYTFTGDFMGIMQSAPIVNPANFAGTTISGSFIWDTIGMDPSQQFQGTWAVPSYPMGIEATVKGLQYASDPRATQAAFALDMFLSQFGPSWNAGTMTMVKINGLMSYYGWGLLGLATGPMFPGGNGTWPLGGLPWLGMGGLIVGNLYSLNPDPGNFWVAGLLSFTPDLSAFYGVFYSIDATSQIPEPATFILLGAGLAGLAWWGRRKVS